MLERICHPIEGQLEKVDEIIEDAIAASGSLAAEVARYTTRNKGKRIRPAVFLLAAELLGVSGDPVCSVASAMELVHTASLVHDDVLDDALLRRGRKSARAKWGNRISVVVGDFLWSCAMQLILETAPRRFFPIVSKAVRATIEGELLEIERQNDPTLDRQTYLKIIEGKTAALFAACGQGGAVMAAATNELESAVGSYAHHLGMAFQLTDDVLDYTCGELEMGKTPGTDLKGGNLTLPLIATLETCVAQEKRFIYDAITSRCVDDEAFAKIKAIVGRRGGIETTMQLAAQHVKQSKTRIVLFRPSFERDALTALAEYVINRCG